MEKSDDIILEEKQSLGKSLSWARTRRELSQEDVAERLNLSKAIINAIENDELIEGVSPTYIRGYQRAYIRFLELDESQLLSDNTSIPQFKGTHENLQVIDKNLSMDGRGSGVGFPFKLLMPLLLIGLTVIYWPQISSLFSRENSEQTTQAATVQTSETDTEVIQTVEIKTTVETDTTAAAVETDQGSDQLAEQIETIENDSNDDQLIVEKIVDPTTPNADESESTTADENNDEELEVASAEPQEAHSKITFIANGESWLDIRDAENTRLFRNTLKLDQITVTGMLPLKIRTGNLQALRVQVSQGEQRKVDIFDDSTTVADFLVEKDESGRLKFTAL